MRRSNEIIANLALIVFALIVFLVAAEISLRALGLTKIELSLYSPDESTIYRTKAHAKGQWTWPGEFKSMVRTNSRGFRGTKEYEIPKPAGVKRVVAIGDSFTFGVGVNDNETFAAGLEERLASQCGRSGVQVVNMGVPGFSTSQELAMLERYGLALEPDVVLLGFFAGNDVQGNIEQSVHYLDVDSLKMKPNSSRPELGGAGKRAVNRIPGYEWLVGHSALANWLRRIYLNLGGQGGVQHPNGEKPSPVQPASLQQDTSYAWRLTERLVARMKTVSEANGSEFLMLIIPDTSELNRYVSGQSDSTVVINGARRICRTLDVNCIDLAEWIAHKSVNPISPVHFPRDGHFTRLGNQLTAEAARDSLAQLLGCQTDGEQSFTSSRTTGLSP